MTVPYDRLQLGEFEIFRLIDGFFRVDGGAMFGVVPKTLWEKRALPDDKNRVVLALNCYLIRGAGSTILVETGVGPDVDRRFIDFYSLEEPGGLFRALKELEIAPGDIDVVLNSHLHFDHCGGNTLKRGRGTWSPAFPQARYIVQKGEWAQALNPVGRDKPSYLPVRLGCLQTGGVLELVAGDSEIVPGIRVFLTPGHTGFHQGIAITSASKTFFYFGDTVPTAAHVDLPYIMSFDLFPAETYDTKRELYRRAVEGNWFVAFSHDLKNAFGTMRETAGRFQFVPIA